MQAADDEGDQKQDAYDGHDDAPDRAHWFLIPAHCPPVSCGLLVTTTSTIRQVEITPTWRPGCNSVKRHPRDAAWDSCARLPSGPPGGTTVWHGVVDLL